MRKSETAITNIVEKINTGEERYRNLANLASEDTFVNAAIGFVNATHDENAKRELKAYLKRFFNNTRKSDCFLFNLGTGYFAMPMTNFVDISTLSYIGGSGARFKTIKIPKYLLSLPKKSHYPPSFFLLQIINFVYKLTGQKGRTPKFFSQALKNYLKKRANIPDNVNITKEHLKTMLALLSDDMEANILRAYEAYKTEKNKFLAEYDARKDKIRINKELDRYYNSSLAYSKPDEAAKSSLVAAKEVGRQLATDYPKNNAVISGIVDGYNLTNPEKDKSYPDSRPPRKALPYTMNYAGRSKGKMVGKVSGDVLIDSIKVLKYNAEIAANVVKTYTTNYKFNPSASNLQELKDKINNFLAYRNKIIDIIESNPDIKVAAQNLPDILKIIVPAKILTTMGEIGMQDEKINTAIYKEGITALSNIKLGDQRAIMDQQAAQYEEEINKIREEYDAKLAEIGSAATNMEDIGKK